MDEKYVESSVKALHKAFQLEDEPANYMEGVLSLS